MLIGVQPGTYLDHNMDEIPYSDFINRELILFSMADNVRSIPSVADGLKPGQRKVIWGCFKRKLKKEIKVMLCFYDHHLLIIRAGRPTCWLYL
jgi:DNA gyrase/topoisomerase IV subunit A